MQSRFRRLAIYGGQRYCIFRGMSFRCAILASFSFNCLRSTLFALTCVSVVESQFCACGDEKGGELPEGVPVPARRMVRRQQRRRT